MKNLFTLKDGVWLLLLAIFILSSQTKASLTKDVSISTSSTSVSSASDTNAISLENSDHACMIGTYKFTTKRLEDASNGFLKSCNLENPTEDDKKQLKALFGELNLLGRIEAGLTGPETNSKLDSFKKDYASTWKFVNKIPFTDYEEMWKAAQDDIENFSEKNKYPQFYEDNLIFYMKYSRQVGIWNQKNLQNSNDCVKWDKSTVLTMTEYALSFKDADGNEIPGVKDNKCGHSGNGPFKIDPLEIEKGGWILTWWVNEDIKNIKTEGNIILNGLKDNAEKALYMIKLFKENERHAKYQIQLSNLNDKFSIGSQRKCNEKVFMMLAIIKDCDSYKVYLSGRAASQQKRAVYLSEKLKANEVEKVKIVLSYEFNEYPQLYTGLVWTETVEKQIVAEQTSASIRNEIKRINNNCNNPPKPRPDCDYSSEDECIICAPNKVLHEGECKSKCPDKTFKKNGKCPKCKNSSDCTDCCLECTDDKEDSCTKCVAPEKLQDGECVKICHQSKWDNVNSDGTHECKDCTDDCDICKSATTCKKCTNGKFLNDEGKCVDTCDVGYRKDALKKECVKCETGCQNCKDNGDCILPCKPSFFWYLGKCLKPCNAGYYGDSDSKKCKECNENCQECDGPTVCKKCKDGFILNTDGTCKTTCNKGSVGSVPDKDVCQPCKPENECDRCKLENLDECTSCLTGNNKKEYLKDGKCVKECGDGYYADGKKCIKCSDNCKTCNDSGCSKCYDKWYLLDDKTCSNECPENYIKGSGDDNTCIKCHDSTCNKCKKTDLKSCTDCLGTKVLHNGECKDKCPDNTFKLSGGKKCQDCSNKCKKCKNENNCEQCEQGYFLNDGVCHPKCPSGTVLYDGTDDVAHCDKCTVDDCERCTWDNKGVCIKCDDDHVLHDGECKKKCPPGTVLEEVTRSFGKVKVCTSCTDSDCIDCSPKDTCKRCETKYLKTDKKCSNECDDKQAYSEEPKQCIPCTNGKCKKCSPDNLDNCIECFGNEKLQDGKCVTQCSDGYHPDKSNKSCVKCTAPCNKCLDAEKCIDCIDKYLFTKDKSNTWGTCTNDCNDGHMKKDGKCIKCEDSTNCKVCSPIDTCITCKKGWFLQGKKCVQTCNDGYYQDEDEKKCKPCTDTKCLKCIKKDQCSICDKSYLLYDNKKCVETCPDGSSPKDGDVDTCVICDSKCKKCNIARTDECSECYGELLLYNGKCVSDCKEGTWKKEDSSQCKDCSVPDCKECIDNGQTCKKCKEGKLLENNKCVSKCTDNKYCKTGDECLPTTLTQCKICEYAGVTKSPQNECHECQEDTYLQYPENPKHCKETCPDGKFIDKATKHCKDCPVNCRLCTSDTCTVCDNGFYWHNNECVPTCPERYGVVDGKCTPCNTSDCSVCDNVNICTDCKSPKILKEGKCVEKCGEGYFNNSGECEKCGYGCEQCIDCNNCKVCKSPWILDGKICKDSCPDGKVKVVTPGKENGECKECTVNKCKKCKANKLDTCEVCMDNLVLKDNKCVEKCGTSYYNINQTCHKCIDKCEKCSDSSNCNKCIDNNFFYLGKCDPCPEGTYENGTVCTPCSNGCQKCSSEECTKCNGKDQVLQDGHCKSECDSYHFEENKKCKKCHVEKCMECPNKDGCSKCESPLFLKDKSKCVPECGDGYKQNKSGSIWTCDKCEVDGCKTCDSDTKKCSKCIKPKYLKKNPIENDQCLEDCPVPFYEFPQDLVANPAPTPSCKECLENCKFCKNDTTCDECQNGHYLSPNLDSCGKCDKGYTPVDNKKCTKCTDNNCITCNPPDKCEKCKEKWYLYNDKTCVEKCPSGYFLPVDGTECKKCADKCLSCDKTKDTCTNCHPGTVLENGVCKDNCSDGFAAVNSVCKKCECKNPKKCLSSNLKKCIECFDTHPLFVITAEGQDCENQCPDKHFIDDTTCTKCSEKCKRCTSSTKCIECDDGSVLEGGVCKEKCSENHLLTSEKLCIPCNDTNCVDCKSDKEKDCNECTKGFYLKDGKCVEECKDGWTTIIDNKEKGRGHCQKCTTECKTCPDGNCNKCNKNYVLQGQKCKDKCDDNYVSISEICEKCHDPKCKKCSSTNLKKCNDCKDGYLLKADGTCSDSCDEGYFANTEKGICEKCTDASCKKCNSNLECTECLSPKVLKEKECKDKCGESYMKKNDANECQKCQNQNCKKCILDGDKEKCVDCLSPSYLHDNSCVENCPDKHAPMEATATTKRRCDPCSTHCVECVSSTDCRKCEGDKISLNTLTKKCTDDCPDGQYGNKETGICTSCGDPNVLDCDPVDPHDPTECKSPYKLEDVTDRYTFASETYEPIITGSKYYKDCDQSSYISGAKCDNGLNGKMAHSSDSMWWSDGNNSNGEAVGQWIQINFKQLVEISKVEFLDRRATVERNKKLEFYYKKTGENKETMQSVIINDGSKLNTFNIGPFKANYVKVRIAEVYKKYNNGGAFKFYGRGVVENKGNKKCVKECKKGTWPEGGKVCKDCEDSNCTDCNPDCTECKDPFVLQDKKCINKCKDGYYKDNSRKCEKCKDSDNCKKCDNNGDCTECQNPKVLHNKQCLISCPDGYFKDSDQKCKKCTESDCNSCPSDNCTKCKNNKKLQGNKCQDECNDGYINNLDKCHRCTNEKCKKCEPSALDKCTECYSGSNPVNPILHESDCINKCPDGYRKKDNKCVKCSENCAKCTETDQCLICKTGSYLHDGKCISQCPDNFGTINANKNDCTKCDDEKCKQCTGVGLTECTKCETYLNLETKKCNAICPDGTRADEETKTCKKCSSNCKKCDADKCNECYENFYHDNNSAAKMCIECKEANQVIINKKECVDCKVSGCVRCLDGNDKKCETCETGKVIIDGQCKDKCEDGSYKIKDEQNCKKCEGNCKICDGEDSCTVCKDGFFLLNGKCSNTCDDGYAKDTEKKTCEPCTQKPKCLECKSDKLDYCEKCDPKLMNHDGTCKNDCPDGTFRDGKKCTKCNEKCKHCNQVRCEICEDGLLFLGRACVEKCGDGYFSDGTSCIICDDSNCKECKPEHTCKKCKENYVLHPVDHKCYLPTDCPDGYFGDTTTKECKKCPEKCSKCSSNKKCTECTHGNYLLGDECVAKCPNGQTQKDGVCTTCPTNCEECRPENPEECTKCKLPKVNLNGKCTDTCNSNQYEKDKICHDCHPTCKFCSGPDTCTACPDHLTLNNGKCENPCTNGYIRTSEGCGPCQSANCKICSANKRDCMECDHGFFLNDDAECKPTCKNGYYINGEKCDPCSFGCQKCSSQNKCDFPCKKGYFFYQDECRTKCPDGSYNDCDKCEQCNEACNKCNGKGNDNCVACKSNYFIQKQRCVKNCSIGFYKDATTNSCKECDIENCDTCTTAGACKNCMKGYDLSDAGKCTKERNPVILFKGPKYFSRFTHETRSAQEKFCFNKNIAEATAVGSYQFSLSFWIKPLKQDLARIGTYSTVIWETHTATIPPIHRVQFVVEVTTSGQSPKCKVRLISPNDEINTIGEVACGYPDLSKNNGFRHFIININKKTDGEADIVLKYHEANKSNFSTATKNINFSSELITKDTCINFNNDAIGDAYSIYNAKIMDYETNDIENASLYIETPPKCDYNCQNCNGKVCLSCKGNLSPLEDGSCPSAYIPVINGQFCQNNGYKFRLRDNRKNDLTHFYSDKWGYSSWVYIEGDTQKTETKSTILSFQLDDKFNLAWKSKSFLEISVKNGVISVNSDEIPSFVFENNNWYAIKLKIKNDIVELDIKKEGEAEFKNFKSSGLKKLFTIYDDLNIWIGKSFEASHANTESNKIGISDARLYLNQEPEDISSLSKDNEGDNCKKLGCDLICKECDTGYNINTNTKTCTKEVLYYQLKNIYSFWNNEQFEPTVPSNIETEVKTINFFFRRKAYSFNENTQKLLRCGSLDLLRIKNVNQKKCPEGKTKCDYETKIYRVNDNNTDGSHITISQPNDSMWHFISVTYSPNSGDLKYATSAWKNIEEKEKGDDAGVVVNQFYDNESTRYQRKVPENEKLKHSGCNLIFGDNSQNDQNYEIANIVYVNGDINDKSSGNNTREDKRSKLFKKEYPRDCSPSCKRCNYATGFCNACAISSSVNGRVVPKSGTTCPYWSAGFNFNYLYGFKDYKSIQLPYNWVFSLHHTFTSGVNSSNYSVMGYLRMYDIETMKKTDGKYILFRVGNIDKIDNPHSPSTNLITLQADVLNGEIKFNFLIDQQHLITEKRWIEVPVDNKMIFTSNGWVAIHAGINGKKFKYTIQDMSKTTDNTYTKDVSLESLPERLSEKGTLKLFGIGSYRTAENKIPNGQFHKFYLNPDFGYNDAEFKKYLNKYTIPKTVPICSENCDTCVGMAKQTTCTQCKTGYVLKNNQCIKSDRYKEGYCLLSSGLVTKNQQFFIEDRRFSTRAKAEIGFYIRKNYQANEPNYARTFLIFGNLSADIQTDSSQEIISFKVKGAEDQSLRLTNMNKILNGEWFYLRFVVNNDEERVTMKKITVQLLDKNNVNISQNSMLFDRSKWDNTPELNLDTLRDELHFFNVAAFQYKLTADLSGKINSFKDCAIDCMNCDPMGNCLACNNGKALSDGTCPKESITFHPTKIADNSGPFRIAVSDYIPTEKKFRTKNFAFTLKYNPVTSTATTQNVEHIVMKFNNLDSSSQGNGVEQDHLTVYFRQLNQNKHQYRLVYTYLDTTTYAIRTQNSIITLENMIYQGVFIGITMDGINNRGSFYVYNNPNSFKLNTLTTGPAFYLTNSAYLHLGDNSSANFEFSQINFYYDHSDIDMKALAQKIRLIQNSCSSGSEYACTKCKEGYTLDSKKDMCIINSDYHILEYSGNQIHVPQNKLSCLGDTSLLSDPQASSYKSCSSSSNWADLNSSKVSKCEDGLDNKAETVWAANGKHSKGTKENIIGSWIKVEFKDVYLITGFKYRNRSSALERTTMFKLMFSDGTEQKVAVENKYTSNEFQDIQIKPVMTAYVKAVVEKTATEYNNGGNFLFYGLNKPCTYNNVIKMTKEQNLEKFSLFFWFKRNESTINSDNNMAIIRLLNQNNEEFYKLYLHNNILTAQAKTKASTLNEVDIYPLFRDNEMETGWVQISAYVDFKFNTNQLDIKIDDRFDSNQSDMQGEGPWTSTIPQMEIGYQNSNQDRNVNFSISNINFIYNNPEYNAISYSDIIKTSPPRRCNTLCDTSCDSHNICPIGHRLDNDISITRNQNKAYTTIKDNYPKLYENVEVEEFLLSFSFQPHKYVETLEKNLKNKNLILVVSNDKEINSIGVNDIIPDHITRYALFTMNLNQDRRGIDIFAGSNARSALVGHYQINLGRDLNSINDVYVSIKINLIKKKVQIMAFFDDLKTLIEFDLPTTSSLLETSTTGFWTNKACGSVHVGLHNPRFDADWNKNLNKLDCMTRNIPGSICNGGASLDSNTCARCLFNRGDRKTTCYKCINGYESINGKCVKKCVWSKEQKETPVDNGEVSLLQIEAKKVIDARKLKKRNTEPKQNSAFIQVDDQAKKNMDDRVAKELALVKAVEKKYKDSLKNKTA